MLLGSIGLVDGGRHIDGTQPKHQSSNILRIVWFLMYIGTRHIGRSPDFTDQRVPACFREVSMYLEVIEPKFSGKRHVRQ